MALSTGDQHDIWIGLISNAIFWVILAVLKPLAKQVSEFLYGKRKYSNRIFTVTAWIAWFVSNILYAYTLRLPNPTLFALLSGAFLCHFLWKELSQFSIAGLLRLDQTVREGLDYDTALTLCTNQLEFLGIGASKLTSSKEFEGAITRCNRLGTPIRFLLTKPDNPILINAAKQKNVNPEEYKKKVQQSLERLSFFKTDRGMNIEVRFYPSATGRDLQFFRMMFINDRLCLLSYNVIGEGDGSQLPQLHLKNFTDKRDVGTFYYPFRMYFEKLWADSALWDFQFPIK